MGLPEMNEYSLNITVLNSIYKLHFFVGFVEFKLDTEVRNKKTNIFFLSRKRMLFIYLFSLLNSLKTILEVTVQIRYSVKHGKSMHETLTE